ncbi:MAG: cobyric acid synthase CobQ, partial [Candidatus Omnitrophica bacterium]|nr:cobyric acid synthase CobQ [Candidatus Omnitrophota bacterium]
PFGIESGHEKVKGLGLIEAVTVMEREKVTSQVKAVGLEKLEFLNKGDEVFGYEIHMGKTDLSGMAHPLFKIIERNGSRVQVMDGAVANGGNVIGTYIHGLFDNDVFRNNLLESLRKKKGTRLKYVAANPYAAKKEENYNKLAEIVRKNLDMKFIMELIK